MRDERSFMLSLEVDAITDETSWAEWEALGDGPLDGRRVGCSWHLLGVVGVIVERG